VAASQSVNSPRLCRDARPPDKISFGDPRDSGVHGILVCCADSHCAIPLRFAHASSAASRLAARRAVAPAADFNARSIAALNAGQWFPMQVSRARRRLGL